MLIKLHDVLSSVPSYVIKVTYQRSRANEHLRVQDLANVMTASSSSFELDVVLYTVPVIPLQHRSCSVCMSFVKLGHHNG